MSSTLRKQCKHCNDHFETERQDKLYCSRRCRRVAEKRRASRRRRIERWGDLSFDEIMVKVSRELSTINRERYSTTYECPVTGLGGITGYKRGCRCDGCRQEKQKALRREKNRNKYPSQLKKKGESWLRSMMPACRADIEKQVLHSFDQILKRKELFQKQRLAFYEQGKELHDDFYNYILVDYVNASTPVCIICPKHGLFWQKPSQHLIGQGCNECGRERAIAAFRMTQEEFINRAIKAHNNRYFYFLVQYIDTKTPVCILCPKHGPFWQTPEVHLKHRCGKYHGCSKCRRSIGEELIAEELSARHISFIEQWKDDELVAINRRSGTYQFDFYLPDFDWLIEFHGQQHFKEVKAWNSQGRSTLAHRQYRDRRKAEFAAIRGWPLHVITYRELNHIPAKLDQILYPLYRGGLL